MKKILLTSILMATFFIGCGEQPTLSKVISKRSAIEKGMTKAQVKKILKVEPDEISQVGNVEVWIYKGVLGNEDEGKTFNDFIVKFKNNKVIYTGFFRCKLPTEE